MTPNIDKFVESLGDIQNTVLVQWEGTTQIILGKYDPIRKEFFRVDSDLPLPKRVLEDRGVKIAEQKYIDLFMQNGSFYWTK